MKKVLVAAARGVEVVVDALSRAAVVAMTVLVLVQIVLRYIFNVPLAWVEPSVFAGARTSP
jgi:TRAP-type C4-dicarboxylate transport system permease small subunit